MKERIYIFGNGKFFHRHVERIKEIYEIVGILDNDIQSKYEEKLGIAIISPSKKIETGLKILIMVKKLYLVFQQLLDLEIEEKNILFGANMFYDSEKEKLFCETGKLICETGNLYFLLNNKEKIHIVCQEELDKLQNKIIREKYKENPVLKSFLEFPAYPISRDFGTGRGRAIDRYYIETFLDKNKDNIKGKVLEIADNLYTLQYGKERVKESYILHIMGWGKNVIKGNLETGEGLEDNMFDTLIVTQTLMFIFDLHRVVDNIYRIMKKNATAFITVAGISQISRYDANNWGSYWGFHKDALKKLFIPTFGEQNVEVNSYGNVKTAAAMLYGLCCEELSEEDFIEDDEDYPVILTIKLKKE